MSEIGARQLEPPVNIRPPEIIGAPEVGVTLTINNGEWTNSPTNFYYWWYRGAALIPGASNPSYTLTVQDSGAMISVDIAAVNNSEGAGYAKTPAIGPVTPLRPANVEPPVLSGQPEVGATLTSSPGAWENSPTTYRYFWQRNGTDIGGVHSGPQDQYTLIALDEGAMISTRVRAANAYGSNDAYSNAVGPIRES